MKTYLDLTGSYPSGLTGFVYAYHFMFVDRDQIIYTLLLDTMLIAAACVMGVRIHNRAYPEPYS